MNSANPTGIDPIHRRVSMVIHDPRLQSEGGRKLHEAFNWEDSDELAQRFIEDVEQVSYGCARFDIVERIEVDGFPVKKDGFVYSEESYLACMRSKFGFHQPDAVDYGRILNEQRILSKIDSGFIDEVWLFAFPYAGYYESVMGGREAIWCNAPPPEETQHCSRRFVIMGFNYERGVGEMLENLGHRAESMLSHVFRSLQGEGNLWERFTRYDMNFPGRAEVGNVHFAPNSVRDYDWGNRRKVSSRCDDWYTFPDLPGRTRRVNCQEWGGGDIRLHHMWWFRHFPHAPGPTHGISHNWWEYVLDPNRV